MKQGPIAVARARPCRSPAVEQALQELAQCPLTEACLHGVCDICVADQTPLCHTVRPRGSRPQLAQTGPSSESHSK
jgi:hypothetical protein